MHELYGSERRFRLLVEGVADYAICMLDPAGIITNWNTGAQRIKGYDALEIIGQHFGIFYPPEDRERNLPAMALETALGEGKYEAEGWRLRKDGTRFFAAVVIDPIYDAGVLVGFAKITRDISERMAAHRALVESERQFRLLVKGVTDYALYMLTVEGYVSSWNAGGEKIKGYDSDEIVGQHFSRFYTPSDQTNGRPARALRIAQEQGRYEEEGWRVRKDGSFFWASVVIDSIRDEEGNLVGFAKITRDITERRDAQLALERVQKQLAESQKLDALGQLTGGVAHDFNNLLMVVSGQIQILKNLTEHDPKGARAAHAIELAARRGATLTRQLLTFARRQRINPQAIAIGEAIRSIQDVLVSGLGANISLETEIDAEETTVTVDVGELEIAMVNLVFNARDAMPNGGVVNIGAQQTSLGKGEPVPPGEYVAITVKDHGVGIPPDIMVKVFDPFFTTKPVGKGTGLGLSQVHGFVHQAGGTIKLVSTLGEGTSVIIYLPVAQSSAAAEVATRSKPQTGTVLLVEDNPDVAGASAVLLEQLGYLVRIAASAEQALAEIERDGITIVLSDIVMPGSMDGLGLARLVQRTHPDLQILLTTGYSDALLNVRDDFPVLRKPYDMTELSEALAALAGPAQKATVK